MIMNKEADLQAQIHRLNVEKRDLAVKLHSLSSGVIMVLKNKALRGCDEKSWIGFQNGNGTEVGKDVERLIKIAEKIQQYLLTVKHE